MIINYSVKFSSCNKKAIIRVILFAFLLIFVSRPICSYAEDKDESSTKHIILIDPGHGGADGGAKSKQGTQEKDINLSISLKLKDKLSDKGYEIYMTRDEDISLASKKRADLEARCKMKGETSCDAFISIHQNKFSNSKCYGAQVWYSDYPDSKTFALSLQDGLRTTIDDDNKRIPKAAKKQYKILRDGYEAPCVIVECGFISNYNEEQKLKTDEFQDIIVDGIVKGIDDYFKKDEWLDIFYNFVNKNDWIWLQRHIYYCYIFIKKLTFLLVKNIY